MVPERLRDDAIDFGFSRAATVDLRRLKMGGAAEIRALCAANACGNYGKNWRCPPAVGSVEACVNEVLRHKDGLVVQYVSQVEDSADHRATSKALSVFRALMAGFLTKLSENGEGAIPLGAGCCVLCEKCAYPDAPCRHPDEAFASVESHGINVMRLCKQAGLPYDNGTGTLTYTGLYLLEEGGSDGTL
jgi:predicted metal-binding protein